MTLEKEIEKKNTQIPWCVLRDILSFQEEK